jgi:Trk K+ transport system NAD-binding subunit
LNLDYFIVCGLGSLGQNCFVTLKEFDVKIIGIERNTEVKWEIPNLAELLDDLIIGDCREDGVLRKAKIEQCRSILIVTHDEEINIQTALTVRQLNPKTRILVRSSKENLNQLLEEQLGNFFAGDSNKLTANAFALASLGSKTLGVFYLDRNRFQVVKREIKTNDSWTNVRHLYEINNNQRQILMHLSSENDIKETFHQWDPDTTIKPGDTVIYVERIEQFLLSEGAKLSNFRKPKKFWLKQLKLLWENIKTETSQVWRFSFIRQVKGIAFVSLIIVIIFLIMGTFLFHQFHSETSILSAFYATAILLLGGYADLFGDFTLDAEIPWWLQFFGLLLTVVGTAFVGVLYALLTEALLSAKLQLFQSRPPIPQNDHVVIIGLEKFGQRIATILDDLKKSCVGIAFNPDFEQSNLPNIPLIIGNLKESLDKAKLNKAKSVVIATNQEILNLEIALMTRAINPDIPLVISTYTKDLSKKLTNLLNNVQILSCYEVEAEVFVGAAFGENIINLFRLNNRTILVTEYQIEEGDTLNGLLLTEIVYGYGVLVILHQHFEQESTVMPKLEIRLRIGDRIVVLATTDSLRRIEQGRLKTSIKCWRVRVEKVLTPDGYFEGANIISRITGSSLNNSRELMKNLPQIIPEPLYYHQAKYLVRELKKALVKAEMVNLY